MIVLKIEKICGIICYFLVDRWIRFWNALSISQWIRCILLCAVMVSIPFYACYQSIVMLENPRDAYYILAYSFTALYIPLLCIGLALIISEER